jgi:hypothetical protein
MPQNEGHNPRHQPNQTHPRQALRHASTGPAQHAFYFANPLTAIPKDVQQYLRYNH